MCWKCETEAAFRRVGLLVDEPRALSCCIHIRSRSVRQGKMRQLKGDDAEAKSAYIVESDTARDGLRSHLGDGPLELSTSAWRHGLLAQVMLRRRNA